MPESPAILNAEHAAYIAARTAGDDDFLAELKEAARAEGLPEIWIAPEQASFMHIVLAMVGAREVVEVGTLAGYSAIVLARAVAPKGRVRTIEIDPGHATFARRWIGRSDVAGCVEVLQGDGRQVLEGMAAQTVDAVFIDADKHGYGAYLEEARRILRPGGVVMVDNAFAFGQVLASECTDPEVGVLRAFNEHMAAASGFRSVIVPLGDGCWLGVRQ